MTETTLSRRTPSLPVAALTGIGTVVAALGLFAAGDIAVVVVGLGAVFAAGLIGLVEQAIARRT